MIRLAAMTETAAPTPAAPARRTVPHAQLASDVRGSVLRLARRMRQQKADVDVSDAQMAALGYVFQEQPLTIGALTEHEGVTPPSMNRTVGKLVDAGLLSRRGRGLARVRGAAAVLPLCAKHSAAAAEERNHDDEKERGTASCAGSSAYWTR